MTDRHWSEFSEAATNSGIIADVGAQDLHVPEATDSDLHGEIDASRYVCV